jgi:hypothetical protein
MEDEYPRKGGSETEAPPYVLARQILSAEPVEGAMRLNHFCTLEEGTHQLLL